MKAILVALIFVISMAVASPAVACSTYQECRASANRGDADAQYNLAWMYHIGQGIERDYAEAARWYRLAAEQGNARAQSNLGFMYSQGRGVEQNEVEALRWYRLAAAQGNVPAQRALDARLAATREQFDRERVARERAAREREERAARELASQEAALAQQAQQLRQVCLSFGIADESAELRECVQRLYIESVRQSQRTADAEREQRQRLEHSQRQSAMAEQAREDRCRLASSMYTSCYGSCLATTAGGFLYASNHCVQQCRPEALERTRACQ